MMRALLEEFWGAAGLRLLIKTVLGKVAKGARIQEIDERGPWIVFVEFGKPGSSVMYRFEEMLEEAIRTSFEIDPAMTHPIVEVRPPSSADTGTSYLVYVRRIAKPAQAEQADPSMRALLEAIAAGPSVIVDKVRYPLALAWEGWLWGSDRPGTQRPYRGALARPAGFDSEVLLVKKTDTTKTWSLGTTYELDRMRLKAEGNVVDDPAARALDNRVRSAASAADTWYSALRRAKKG